MDFRSPGLGFLLLLALSQATASVPPPKLFPADGATRATATPNIELSTDTLDFGTLFVGNPLADTLEILNSGTDTLQILVISSSHPDYSADVVTFSLAPLQIRAVSVTFVPSVAGPITGTLFIASDDPDQALLEVALLGHGLEPPVIGAVSARFY